MPNWIRLFSLEEANALIPELDRMLRAAQRVHRAVHTAQAHVQDLEIVWGDRVHEPDCPDRPEYEARVADLKAKRLALHTELRRFAELGVEVKDVDSGLLDFYAVNGDKLVYLCWKQGEEQIVAWHTLQGGFSARKPLPDFLEKGPSR